MSQQDPLFPPVHLIKEDFSPTVSLRTLFTQTHFRKFWIIDIGSKMVTINGLNSGTKLSGLTMLYSL